MVPWFMMKPIMYLCIKDLESVEINIYWTLHHVSELNTGFKTISRDWQIESPQSCNLQMLIISWPWALLEYGFPIIWRMSFFKKLQLANEFSVSKVNCDGNTLFFTQKSWITHYFFKKSTLYLLKTMLL